MPLGAVAVQALEAADRPVVVGLEIGRAAVDFARMLLHPGAGDVVLAVAQRRLVEATVPQRDQNSGSRRGGECRPGRRRSGRSCAERVPCCAWGARPVPSPTEGHRPVLRPNSATARRPGRPSGTRTAACACRSPPRAAGPAAPGGRSRRGRTGPRPRSRSSAGRRHAVRQRVPQQIAGLVIARAMSPAARSAAMSADRWRTFVPTSSSITACSARKRDFWRRNMACLVGPNIARLK